MKKAVWNVALSTVVVLALSLSAAAKSKTMTWKGWISDGGCGVKGMSADHKDCALKCVKEKGAKYVFVNSENKAVFAIHNQDAVSEPNLGQEVSVTGHTMKGKLIHVDSIQSVS